MPNPAGSVPFGEPTQPPELEPLGMYVPSSWSVYRRQGQPFSSVSAESSSLLASSPRLFLAHLSGGLPQGHPDSHSAGLPSAAASQDFRAPDSSPRCPRWSIDSSLVSRARPLAASSPVGRRLPGAPAGKGLACRAGQRGQRGEDRAALSLAIHS